MRYSHYFTHTFKNPPAEADTANAKYLIQGGFVSQLSAGIYTFLPLGLRVMHKVMKIIREEMNAIGGQEIIMPALHPSENWNTTGRDVTCADILYRTEGHGGKVFYLGQTHEEIVTPLVKQFVNSYKDLPLAAYQIQNKFRNEPRAKSGILRGREFCMKDMYSFHADEADLDRFYQLVIEAYLKVFERCGLEAYVVKASGGSFSDKESDEFQVLTDAGEDIIYYDKKTKRGYNEEVSNEHSGENLIKGKAVEAGNIFKLGTKFSEDFGLYYMDEHGNKKPVIMGCHGIGISRLVGTIVEANHDEKGIIWPANVAPYHVHLLTLGNSEDVMQAADKLYQKLLHNNVEVLWDDRDERAGAKFNDADLIGIPNRIVLSERTLNQNQVEFKLRSSDQVKMIDLDKIIEELIF
ncbi:hypothetical protein GF376_03330 [Candidatus Peregrinibacteria bacterium]|nr:hypothetical protein [Candidatus Peregrinibacteria bacterium]